MLYPSTILTEHFYFKSYTLLSDEDHRIIWQMRNTPEIRKYMDNPEAFSFDSHKKFVDSLSKNNEKAYYGVFELGG